MKKLISLTLLIICSALNATELREEIGQMLIIGFHHPEDAKKHILNDHIGGVILFDNGLGGQRNIESREQLKNLIRSLKELNPKLIVAVDQEGGKVRRLKAEKGFHVALQSAKYYGTRSMPNITYNDALKEAQELSKMGVNVNFGPVLDLAINENTFIARSERSYGKDPGTVSGQASAFIKAMHNHDVLCALKHFPGHGSSQGDTHQGFVDTSESWNEQELEPYKNLFNSGFNDFVMTTHCVNCQLDPNQVPATCSKSILTDLLRTKLGFKGVLVTDDLTMKAMTDKYTLRQMLKDSINAGADMLILANHKQNDTKIAIDLIEDLVKTNEISENRIHEAFQRIQTIKERI